MATGVTEWGGRVREAGDAALVLELGVVGLSNVSTPPDIDVNTRAIAIARAVRRRALPGVRDVTSTFRSVAVFFDPLSTDIEGVAAALREEASAPPQALSGGSIEVPVVYGGGDGPDLARVAAFAHCSPEAVIDRHVSRTYRVFMRGFLPGFAYMASVDETISAPRHATPRLRVPAGSVGIAGRQTGIYPCDSPGGWQIIGRTATRVFDVGRTPTTLFEPGDEVRFVPISAGDAAVEIGGRPTMRRFEEGIRIEGEPSGDTRGESTFAGARCVIVLRPGLLTTVQDAGRWGYQDLGVPVSGPMDPVAYGLANALVGNLADAAALEVTWIGPELRVEQETLVAVAGGDLGATLDQTAVPPHTPVRCASGSVLRFGGRRSGARAYVAFDGGVAVLPVFGSRATHVASGLGGVEGRAVRAGDRIPLGQASGGVMTQSRSGLDPRHESPPAQPPTSHMPPPRPAIEGERAGGARLRVLPGPQAEYFGPSAMESLRRTRFAISSRSDRMGYRLTGGAPLPCAIGGDMVSEATFVGAVQVPPSGDPILLMADRPTTGGYPQLAIVITADLPRAGQLGPGDWVEFDVCSRADALAALVAQDRQRVDVG